MTRNPAGATLAFLLAVLTQGGCQVAPVANTNTNSPAGAAPQGATPAATPAQSASAVNQSVTLPVLDAFFADDQFASELKAKLQLTDDQIIRLREIAKNATAGLRAAGAEAREDYQGSTREATARAAGEIRSIVGDEKTNQLFQLVSERWRGGEESMANALPAKPNAIPTDTRVVVNAPAYRMDVFRDGRLLKTYRVGIGYPEFPLPTGLRVARLIIFNPTWTPPDEPWVEAPESKVKAGEEVPAGSPLNPLGRIKIPIGMPSLIHGGKSPAKLGSFASHGCVGLTDAQVQDFAVVLAGLAGTQLTKEEVGGYAKKKTETKNLPLQRPIPVELRYETIVVEDGKLHVYRDVYDQGTNTEENLRAVLEAHGVSPDQLSQQERQQVADALRQMARDAQGNPAEGDGPENGNKNGNNSARGDADNNAGKGANNNAGRDGNANDQKVTRSVKGKKEIVIEIAALRGRGYPAPFALDAGGAPAKRPGRRG